MRYTLNTMCKKHLTDREIADKILEEIKEGYGFIPLVNQVLSRRPDVFIPAVNLSKAVLNSRIQKLETKTAYLCAISAASALSGEHCIGVQIKHAIDAGATKDEIFESIIIGSYMAMTKSQSYAFRKYEEIFKEE